MDEELLELLQGLSDDDLAEALEGLPDHVVAALLEATSKSNEGLDIPLTVLDQACELDPKYRTLPHLEYLSDRLTDAVRRVEAGESVFIRISMPPRSGKSEMASVNFPAWLLRKHPDWKIGLMSHSPNLATDWGRKVRRVVEKFGPEWNVELARDAGAVADWQTTAGGAVRSRSVPGQALAGIGFKVLMVDDAVKDFASAHNENAREVLWNWWRNDAYTRLEPPFLVVVIGTRWHEDDLLGRLSSPEYEGDPGRWEVIELPAIAEEHDVLGRAPGDPLFSPLVVETPAEALKRWADVRATTGPYAWASLYQQRPTPARGAVFDMGWWRFWTFDPDRASRTESGELDPDGSVVLFTREELERGTWLDSWDAAFKGGDGSDFVVGQRWVQLPRYRVLVDQHRERMTFTRTLEVMLSWAGLPMRETATQQERALAREAAPWGWKQVSTRLIEEKANGAALMDVLRKRLGALVPVNPRDSKLARAHAVTPLLEARDVLVPLPAEAPWVTEYLDEFRAFPSGAHDDQVDATTQALNRMRPTGQAGITVPGHSRSRVVPPAITALTRANAARADLRRLRG